MLLVCGSAALAQHGLIRGQVLTQDGQPAVHVSVCLKNTPYGTQSDDKGRYLLRNIRPGRYTLSASLLGLQPHEQAIELAANQTLELNLTLPENAR